MDQNANCFNACVTSLGSRLTSAPGTIQGNYNPEIYAVNLDTSACTLLDIDEGNCADEKAIAFTAPILAGDADGNDVFANDLSIFSEPISYIGIQSTDASEQGLLSETGYKPGLPPFDIPVGAPAPSVPEPEAWVLMLAGLGLTGAQLRRRADRGWVRRSQV